MSSIEDSVTNLLTQALSLPLVISSLAIGYSLLFVYFYGPKTSHWKDTSFGERLIFGFLIGIPCALFLAFTNTLLGTLAAFLNVSYPWDTGEYVLSGVFILLFVWIRLQLGVQLHSEERTKLFRGFVLKRRAFIPYLPTVFLLVLLLSIKLLSPAIEQYYLDVLELAVIQSFFTLVIAYPFMFSTVLVLTSPRQYGELLRVEFDYLIYLDWIEKMIVRVASLVKIAPWKKRRLGKKWYALSVIVIIALGAYIPVADQSLGLFTPRLEATTFSSDPTSIIEVSSSATNISVLYVELIWKPSSGAS